MSWKRSSWTPLDGGDLGTPAKNSYYHDAVPAPYDRNGGLVDVESYEMSFIDNT